MFKTFKEWLDSKNITTEDYEAKGLKDMASLQKEYMGYVSAELKKVAANKDDINTSIKAFEAKYKGVLEAKNATEQELKDAKEELKKQIDAVQAHADKLDVKLQAKNVQDNAPKDAIKGMITDNFEKIQKVESGEVKQMQVKVVGDMTLGASLTGDQPRDYNFDVVLDPGQKLNVADLAGSVAISGGTYTFVRETGGEGSPATQTEGSEKAQVDYDYSMLDVNTDFIAGFSRYSKKMRNNLPFLETSVPRQLRRDYFIAENAAFNTVLAAAATASSQIITSKNKIEMLINETATLEDANFTVNAYVVRPSDYWDILKIEKSTGAGYGLPGVVTMDNGTLRINGIPVFKATWLAANKYYVGDFSRLNKITTEGLSLTFSDIEGTNFVKNNITAKIEAQVALAVEQPAAIIIGDFTAT